MPFSFAGLRFARTTHGRFCISASGMNFTRPLTTVRSFPSPRSISSTYRLSASGCFHALTMRPTRMSSLEISEYSGPAGTGGAAFPFGADEPFSFPSPFLPFSAFAPSPDPSGAAAFFSFPSPFFALVELSAPSLLSFSDGPFFTATPSSATAPSGLLVGVAAAGGGGEGAAADFAAAAVVVDVGAETVALVAGAWGWGDGAGLPLEGADAVLMFKEIKERACVMPRNRLRC
mmetsp:Transcript_44744/g.72844  ORF Transcript_44744/g.72844 Transcript_44744/m.72844 type:complete len:232 (-) Transcript_44744:496-1191(-)